MPGISVHIFYSGTVQGVGFRYSTQQIAQHLGLVGWVKNLQDGQVEVVSEGQQEAIDQMVRNIDQRFGGYIKNKNITIGQPSGKFQDFQIKF